MDLNSMTSSPPLWKASIALAKAEAPDMASLLELASEPQAVLIAEEPFGANAVVEALYTEEPDAAQLSKIAGRAITVEPLPDQDWIRLSQEGLPPVRAGRFFVYGAHDAGQVPHGVIPMRISGSTAGVRYDGGNFTVITMANRATVYYNDEFVMQDCLAIMQ